jgi:ribonuclease BN (tRNA processing enzyme)
VVVYSQPDTLDVLRTHIFNWKVWPDFTVIPSVEKPTLRFESFQIGDVVSLSDKRVEILPAVHTVPAVGFAVSSPSTQGRHWVFTGDTAHNPLLWKRLANINVGMLVIETAFSDRELELAELSKHLAPVTLARELQHFKADVPIHITHTKPSETAQILQEIQALSFRGEVPNISLLKAGQEFEL